MSKILETNEGRPKRQKFCLPVHSRILVVRVAPLHPVLEVFRDLVDALWHVHLARPPHRLGAQEHVQVAVGGSLVETDPLEQGTDQSRHVSLELPVGGAPLEHGVDVAESGEGGRPRDVLRLLVQVGRHAQGQLVVEVPGTGEVQGVVNDLGGDSIEKLKSQLTFQTSFQLSF